MQLDARVHYGWFSVEQSLCQGCLLMPFLFKVFFAAGINVAYTRFKAEKNTMDAFWYTWGRKRELGGRGKQPLERQL